MSEAADLPLFPLGMVLFPKQFLPLHVFEERYKLMIGECMRDKSAFGVVLIKEGREVGEPAAPFSIGTTAQIVDMQPLGQGRMGLRTVGEQPFRILEITQKQPYMRALVKFLEHGPGEGSDIDSLAHAVREQFSMHLDILASLSDKDRPDLDLNIDPESLSYLVASVMSIEMPEKQQLLELRGVFERLRKEATILTRENRALQTFVYLQGRRHDQPDQADFTPRFSPN